MDYIALDQLKNSPIEKTMLQTKHDVYVGTKLMILRNNPIINSLAHNEIPSKIRNARP